METAFGWWPTPQSPAANYKCEIESMLLNLIPSHSGGALLGFAGDLHHGARIVEQAAMMQDGKQALEFLRASHWENPGIDFAYGYLDDAGSHLCRVSEGSVREVQSLHIGLPDAFDHLQRIRHDTKTLPQRRDCRAEHDHRSGLPGPLS